MPPSDLLHPVRLRIVQVLNSEGTATTQILHAALADVPIATLYRQVAHLLERGVIETIDEQQVRGATEKTFRLAPGLSNPTAEQLNALSADELQTAFTVFASGLISEFARYASRSDRDLAADRVSFAQAGFWASDAEMDEFGTAMMTALTPLLSQEPTPERRRRTLATVVIPGERRPAAATDVAATEDER